MNDSCTPGLTYLFNSYQETHTEIYNALEEETHHSARQDGMVGEALPYQLRSDWMATSLLFVCFIIVSYVLMRSGKYIVGQFQFFFSNKERNGLFDVSTSSEVRYRIALVLQSCMLFGFCIYDYFSEHNSYLFAVVPHLLLLVIFITQVVFFVLFKWLTYLFVNWIYFYKTKQKIWLDSFSNIVIWCGFLLFPIVLLIVYFDLKPQIAANLLLIVIILAKILLFYKCFSNFFKKIYGIVHLILYFCALEVAPDLVLFKGILLANNSLVLNF